MTDISAIVAAVQIESIRLVESAMRTDISAPPKAEVEAEFGHKSAVAGKPDKDGLFLVRTDFTFAVKEGGGQTPVSITATFELHYRLPVELKPTSSELDEFGNANAVFNAWPYWREYLQSSLVRMGLPPFTLPVFRLQARKPSKKKPN